MWGQTLLKRFFLQQRRDWCDSIRHGGGTAVNQGIIAAILSIIFYLTSLLGGTVPQQPPLPAYSAFEQQTVSSIMGRRAVVLGENRTSFRTRYHVSSDNRLK